MVGTFVIETIKERVARGQEDAFVIIDLADIHEKYSAWKEYLPDVEPFYAVKCNDDPSILAELVRLGVNFDCASKGEIQKVISLGASPDRIIYANPCKQESHIRFACQAGVNFFTFDNIQELYKIKKNCPNARVLLRLLPDDSKSVCRLGQKFGASLSVVPALLRKAVELGIEVCGVSYHVGSGCYDEGAFTDAIYLAKRAFDIAAELGINLQILDIGGGFPGDSVASWSNPELTGRKITFPMIAEQIRYKIDELFPKELGVRVIAEPGRYFVHSAGTLAVSVIAKRSSHSYSSVEFGTTTIVDEPERIESSSDISVSDDSNGYASNPEDCSPVSAEDEPTTMYYVNEGVYGCFNNIIYDHAHVAPRLLNEERMMEMQTYSSSIWGPTCDGLDCVMRNIQLPELEIGTWMYFENMGAYTVCAAASFNGFDLPSRLVLPAYI